MLPSLAPHDIVETDMSRHALGNSRPVMSLMAELTPVHATDVFDSLVASNDVNETKVSSIIVCASFTLIAIFAIHCYYLSIKVVVTIATPTCGPWQQPAEIALAV